MTTPNRTVVIKVSKEDLETAERIILESGKQRKTFYSDEQPRMQGRWVKPTIMAIRWHCSVCNNTCVSKVEGLPSQDFCPNCGADMREGEQDETD